MKNNNGRGNDINYTESGFKTQIEILKHYMDAIKSSYKRHEDWFGKDISITCDQLKSDLDVARENLFPSYKKIFDDTRNLSDAVNAANVHYGEIINNLGMNVEIFRPKLNEGMRYFNSYIEQKAPVVEMVQY